MLGFSQTIHGFVIYSDYVQIANFALAVFFGVFAGMVLLACILMVTLKGTLLGNDGIKGQRFEPAHELWPFQRPEPAVSKPDPGQPSISSIQLS